DARGIARFAAERNPEPSLRPSKAQQTLRDLMRSRTLLVSQRDALRNHLRTIGECAASRKIIESMIKKLDKQINKCEAEARKAIRCDKALSRDCAQLTGIYGVGELTAMVV